MVCRVGTFSAVTFAGAVLVGAMVTLSAPGIARAQSVDGHIVTLADADATQVDIANQITRIEAAMASEAAFKSLIGDAANQSAELVAAVVAWVAAGDPALAPDVIAWALEAVAGTPAEGGASLIAATAGGLAGVDPVAVNDAVQDADISAATKTQVAGVLGATGGGHSGSGGGVGSGGIGFGAIGMGGSGGGGVPGTGGGAS